MSPATKPPVRRSTPISGRGEPFVWLTGIGLSAATLMIVSLLVLVISNGTLTFWPAPLHELTLRDGTRVLGEVRRTESYRPGPEELEALSADVRRGIEDAGGVATRLLLRTGNYDLYGDDFRWVSEHAIASRREPAEAWLIERLEWGPAIGIPREIRRGAHPIADSAHGKLAEVFERERSAAAARSRRIQVLEKHDLGRINDRLEKGRLAVRRAAIQNGEGSPEHQEAASRADRLEHRLGEDHHRIQEQAALLRAQNDEVQVVIEDLDGRLITSRPGSEDPLRVSQVVRAYPANALGWAARFGVFLDRWVEFLTSEPREANTEGGVFPAIFGTFMMTVMMSLAVAPFGIMAALYLREYARQGPVVSAVRIAVNNLAGVPSIVYGVFGLGFFCYALGGTIDEIFFPERLPSPTFGTGGILWASLTLALLTVPVVIVATEEALAAVPRSMREGSYACGASRWQTIWRIVLPRATPGIMTGLILAMARGAGEVAPLMITGVVKLAPELPFDTQFPFLHLERSFMHLGFHIYDVGFQSRNSEAGKPMVYTTTLLLIGLILMMNLAAIALRTRLKRRFRSDHF